MKGTSVVECNSLKLSSTNVKLDTVQTSIFVGIGGKLLETLRQIIEEWYAPYTVYCEREQEYEYSVPFPKELGTCEECKPTSIAPTFETSLREARVGYCSGCNTCGRRRPDIFGLNINGESLTLLNLIGVIRHAHSLASCIKSTRMSHRPSYHNSTIVLLVHLEYCIQACRPYRQKDIDILERVQRRATKMIQRLRSISYEMRLKECGKTTLETRRLRGDQIEVFKILNGYESIDGNIFLSVKKESRTRGHGITLAKKQCRLDIRKCSFSQRTVN